MSTSKYGYFFARGMCIGCKQQYIKRRLYKVFRMHESECQRGHTIYWHKTRWSYYIAVMRNGSHKYVESIYEQETT